MQLYDRLSLILHRLQGLLVPGKLLCRAQPAAVPQKSFVHAPPENGIGNATLRKAPEGAVDHALGSRAKCQRAPSMISLFLIQIRDLLIRFAHFRPIPQRLSDAPDSSDSSLRRGV
jgi:hypothetical protein